MGSKGTGGRRGGWSRREFLGAVAAGSACALVPLGLGGCRRGSGADGLLLRDVLLNFDAAACRVVYLLPPAE